MQIRIAKSQREDKTAYVAVRAGEMTGFAAVGAFFGIGQMRSSRRSAMSAASVTPA